MEKQKEVLIGIFKSLHNFPSSNILPSVNASQTFLPDQATLSY